MSDTKDTATSDTGGGPESFLVSGSFIREALAIEEVRESVRAGLRDRAGLPHFSREEMASIVRTYLTEDQKDAKRNGVHKG